MAIGAAVSYFSLAPIALIHRSYLMSCDITAHSFFDNHLLLHVTTSVSFVTIERMEDILSYLYNVIKMNLEHKHGHGVIRTKRHLNVKKRQMNENQ